jgi:hypothetical protein
MPAIALAAGASLPSTCRESVFPSRCVADVSGSAATITAPADLIPRFRVDEGSSAKVVFQFGIQRFAVNREIRSPATWLADMCLFPGPDGGASHALHHGKATWQVPVAGYANDHARAHSRVAVGLGNEARRSRRDRQLAAAVADFGTLSGRQDARRGVSCAPTCTRKDFGSGLGCEP